MQLPRPDVSKPGWIGTDGHTTKKADEGICWHEDQLSYVREYEHERAASCGAFFNEDDDAYRMRTIRACCEELRSQIRIQYASFQVRLKGDPARVGVSICH